MTAAVILILAFHLSDIGSVPPGLNQDEAAIGYNAWAIANRGVDEAGEAWPLFFEEFGDWINPIYIYTLAPLTRVFSLTPTLVRIPAALMGLAICLVFGVTAWRLARERWVGLATGVVAAFTPWVVMQGRFGNGESVTLVLLTSLALLGAVRLTEGPSRRWALVAGVALAASPFAYAPGRLAGLMFGVVFCAVIGARRRLRPALIWLIPPLVVSYGTLAVWAHANPGALTARFHDISVLANSPSSLTAAGRVVRNYLGFFGPQFLALRGDASLRHNTGAGGMLLFGMVPALLVGVWWCLKHWRDPVAQLLLLGLLAAPVPASLTFQELGTPHALRSSIMLPFLFAVSVVGWGQLVSLSTTGRTVTLLAALLIAGQATFWTVDFFRSYPERALTWFDAGDLPAIEFANDIRGSGRLFLSEELNQPYVFYLWATLPDPRVGLDALGIEQASPQEIANQAMPGDVVVLAPWDSPPPGAVSVITEQTGVGVWRVE